MVSTIGKQRKGDMIMLFKQISLAVMTAMTIGTAALPAVGAMAATENATNTSEVLRAAEATVVMWVSSSGVEHTVTITCTLPLTSTKHGPDSIGRHWYIYTDANGTTWDGSDYF